MLPVFETTAGHKTKLDPWQPTILKDDNAGCRVVGSGRRREIRAGADESDPAPLPSACVSSFFGGMGCGVGLGPCGDAARRRTYRRRLGKTTENTFLGNT